GFHVTRNEAPFLSFSFKEIFRRRSPMIKHSTARGAVAAISLFLFLSNPLSLPARADDPPKAPDAPTDTRTDAEKLKELEQKVDVLTKEIESMRLGETPAQQGPPAPGTAAAAAAPPSAPPPR